MRAIEIKEHGGPEVLELGERDATEPGPAEVQVAVDVAGLNFIDVYHREGRYAVDLPFVPGVEGAGTITAVGADDGDDGEWSVGERVAWVMTPGAYAESAVVPVHRLVRVPDGVDTTTAAAVLLQGLTAQYLTTSVFPVEQGHVVLVHAAAGGVGRLLVQLNAAIGATVIATASSPEKLAIAESDGAQHLIDYSREDFVERTREITDGVGVDVVFDGVGRATFTGGLDVLKRRGTMALYGAASGPVEPVDPMELARRGSLVMTRAGLADFIATSVELRDRVQHLWDRIDDKSLHVTVDRTFPLADAADAHRYIEGRRTKGKVLLSP